jgi:hypothetical protein
MLDLYGNDDYAAEDEILGIKSTSPEKIDPTPAEATRPSNTAESTATKPVTQNQAISTPTPKPAEFVPEPTRAAPAPPPQIGSSIATYTSDEGTTLPPTGYNNGYSSLPPSMRPFDPEAEKQGGSYPKPISTYVDTTQGGAPTSGYNDQSDGGSYQQKQGGYANGAVFESSNHQGGYGGGQRGGFGGFNAGAGNAGGRRFDSVRPSEMKDEG